jgi:hypothetical protein
LVTLDVDLVNQTTNKNYSIKNSMQSNLNTYFVNDRTMGYYAHDIVDSGSKYLVSMVNSYHTHHQQLLFNKLQSLKVDLHLLLAIFSNFLTHSQQINFGEIP